MAVITVSPSMGDDDPPIGIIDTDDTCTAVIPLDDLIVFIAVDSFLRSQLVATLQRLAAELDAEPATT